MEFIYKNIDTGEEVFEEDAEDYAMEHLGIRITPKGKNGELTKEQTEFIVSYTEWYFSADWYKEIYKEEDEDYDAYMIDKIYQENLERRLLNEGY